MKAMEFEKRQRTLSSLMDVKKPKAFVAVIKLLVRHGCPLAMVEDPDFRTLAEGKYHLLMPSNVRPMIIGVAELIKEEQFQHLKHRMAFDGGRTNVTDARHEVVLRHWYVQTGSKRCTETLLVCMKKHVDLLRDHGAVVVRGDHRQMLWAMLVATGLLVAEYHTSGSYQVPK
eukprot:PhM_4_TR16126/c1_g2_i1/m.101264